MATPLELQAGKGYTTIAAAASKVINMRPKPGYTQPAGMVVFLNGGTATYQPCDCDGTVIAGSSSTAVVNGDLIPNEWPFYLVTAAVATCTVAVVGAQAVTIQTGDREIGAVELKNAGDDTRAVVGSLSTITSSSTGLPVANYPVASEVHMGEVGGKMIYTSDSFAALAAGDYAANDVVAADANNTATTPLRSFTVGRVNGGSGYIVYLRGAVNNTSWLVSERIDFYTVAQPTTALVGDNVASAPKFANDGQYIGSVTLNTYTVPTGADMVRMDTQDSNIRIPFKCAVADNKIYYRVVTLTACANETAGQTHNYTIATDDN